MLMDRFYFNLKTNPFNARLQGDYRFSDGRLSVSGFDIQWKDLLTVHADGHGRSKPTLSDLLFRLDLSSTPLSPIYELFVLEPFKTEKPILEKLSPAGQISSRLTIKGDPHGFTVKGHCSMENGSLTWPEEELSLEGIDLKLPIWYRNGPAGHKQAKPLDGRLSIRTVRHAFLPEQSVDIPMKAGPNRLLFRGPITLKIPGGDLRMDSIDFRDILMPAMVVRSGITLNDVRIQPLMGRFWPRPVEGTARGRISPILFREKEIDTKGELNVNLFEGDIVINNIGVANLFDSIPLLKLDATWRDLDLAKMTTDTAFGKVEGILKGQVEDLEIAAGQPQRFQLRLETVKKAGVPQRISIKAVDNIARIGGGQSPFMGLAGTFASLFKTFPYEKIGARASLENDVFRINGLVKEDNLEYIIKRGGIRGVNVVNQNPDNRIRFKDMVKRIKRITTSKGGPLVK
jgi:hypothetical protein